MTSLVFPSNLKGFDINVNRSPVFATLVQTAASGKELRASFEAWPRYRYTLTLNFARELGYSQATYDEADTLSRFFQIHLGSWDSFLFTDPYDNAVSGMGFGVGDGTTTAFQLQRILNGQITDQLGTWPAYSTPRTNMALQSQALDNASWSNANATVAVNGAVAPDGSTTAELFTVSATSSPYGTQTVTLQPGMNTVSVWMKGYGSAIGKNAGPWVWAAGTGTLVGGGNGQPSIWPALTGSWQRYTLTANVAVGGTFLIRWDYSHGNSVVGEQCAIWGFQCETGSVATPYIPTTTASVTITPNYWPQGGDGFEPIYNLNPATPLQVYRNDWQGNQLMYQTTRTNLATYSEQLDNAAWTKTNATISANATAAPDGNTTADKIQETATTGLHYAQDAAISIVNGTTYTATIFAKAAERTLAIFQADAVGGKLGGTACFDLSAGTVSNIGAGITAATITALANGWWRLSITAVATGTSASPAIGLATSAGSGFPSYAGTAGNGIYAWGLDLKADTGSSYIGPTTSAPVSVIDFAVDGNAKVTFNTAPVSGAVLTWTGSYYRRVRFDGDQMELERIGDKVWDGKTVKLITVK